MTTAPTVDSTELTAGGSYGKGDRVFSRVALASGLTILVTLAAVFIFLAIKGLPGFAADSEVYGPSSTNAWGYVGRLLFGTTLAALIALVIAVPFSFALALFITHYAPKRIATPVAYIIDLLAAVPSVVFGLWGARSLAVSSQPVQRWLDDHAGWLPFFKGPASSTGRTILVAGIVLAIMCIPIITAISREVFLQTPRLNEEAALALGATRWETIRLAVFPNARSGMIAAVMLGLGRALGETMAVAMVLSATPIVTLNLISSTNPATIASNIAANYKAEDNRIQTVLLATGLVLFLFTFLVNFSARFIASRRDAR
ncbi:phosphate ABC transporter permease subunit PstC [Nocardioides sp. Kera G14]|uniref:phosphate ABC transporter permease subunit PstC n=1 Tax=Nocardioides sp. Kera G14 TaxID=2884264 RepID=UPI001D1037F6|nr:phosphate ABC transporter permease subunit PstC [Nocardioides sp. Kera G14]UDY23144.1 phosphate ABC transporter permease subunit PstC [Nocardioides sp. Kera G14]